jgi:hypothetical protein
MNSGKILIAAIVGIMAAKALVTGFRMNETLPRALPTGRDDDIKPVPVVWYHRAFYIVGGSAGLAAALYCIVTAVIANG